MVIDPTDLGATTAIAPGLKLDNILPIPHAESVPFYPCVLKLVVCVEVRMSAKALGIRSDLCLVDALVTRTLVTRIYAAAASIRSMPGGCSGGCCIWRYGVCGDGWWMRYMAARRMRRWLVDAVYGGTAYGRWLVDGVHPADCERNMIASWLRHPPKWWLGAGPAGDQWVRVPRGTSPCTLSGCGPLYLKWVRVPVP